MTDSRIHVEKRRLHLKQTWTIARGSSEYRDNIFVTIERDGITGYGEGAPIPRYDENADTAVQFVENAIPLLESSDWRHLVDINRAGSTRDSGNQAAKAAIDIALLDWFCKAHKMTLYRHLGLDPEKSATTFYSIGIDTPDKIQEKARRAQDFPILKVKAGLDSDEEVLAAVRSVTDKPYAWTRTKVGRTGTSRWQS